MYGVNNTCEAFECTTPGQKLRASMKRCPPYDARVVLYVRRPRYSVYECCHVRRSADTLEISRCCQRITYREQVYGSTLALHGENRTPDPSVGVAPEIRCVDQGGRHVDGGGLEHARAEHSLFRFQIMRRRGFVAHRRRSLPHLTLRQPAPFMRLEVSLFGLIRRPSACLGHRSIGHAQRCDRPPC